MLIFAHLELQQQRLSSPAAQFQFWAGCCCCSDLSAYFGGLEWRQPASSNTHTRTHSHIQLLSQQQQQQHVFPFAGRKRREQQLKAAAAAGRWRALNPTRVAEKPSGECRRETPFGLSFFAKARGERRSMKEDVYGPITMQGRICACQNVG